MGLEGKFDHIFQINIFFFKKKEVKLLGEPREGKKKAALDRVFPRVVPSSKFKVTNREEKRVES